MRKFFAAVLLAAIAAAAPAQAADTAQQSTMKSCAAKWSATSAKDKAATKYQDYMSGCLKGGTTTATATPAKAVAASGSHSAKCRDGSTVAYTHRQGTCSGHGGVATWL